MIPPLQLPPPCAPGQPLLAERWNALLAAVESLRPHLEVQDPQGAPPHPWKVAVAEDPADAAKLRVKVLPGCANDQAATIVWKAKGDPRGDMPEASVAAWKEARKASPESEFLKVYHDRPLYEADAPFLQIGEDPEAEDSDWQQMPRARAPKALAAAAPEDAKFYMAGVVLAAFPFNILVTVPLPKRFRVYAGRANPAAVRSARAGELLQLARIWQVRDKQKQRVGLQAAQDVFWNLGCMAVEPQLQDIPDMTLPPAGLPLADAFLLGWNLATGALTNIVNGMLQNMEFTLETTEFWTAP